MGKPKAQKYKAQRDRKRRDRREQAKHQAQKQLPQVLPHTPKEPPPVTPTSSILQMKVAFPRAGKVLHFLFGTCIIVVIGLIADVNSLFPRVSASPIDGIDPWNPSSALITIKNDNFFALNEIQYACIQVKGEGSGGHGNVFVENWVGSAYVVIERLDRWQPRTISCAAIQRAFVTSMTVDFMVVVSFFPVFIPYRSERIFRFEATLGPDGQVRIVPQPAPPLSEMELSKNPYFKDRWQRARTPPVK